MAATAYDIFSRIASGTPIHPFDPVNDPTLYVESKNTAFYATPLDKAEESVRRKLAQARVMAYGAALGSKNVERWFCSTPVTSSLETYRLLQNKRAHMTAFIPGGWMTVQDPQNQLSKNELVDRIILPNLIDSHWKAAVLERALPDKGVMAVSDVEGPMRFMRGSHATNGGAHFQGADYEHYWVPMVWLSHGYTHYRNHAESRHGNAEEIAADHVQCGFLDDARKALGLPPGRVYDIMGDGAHVPLSDRAWETAKHIFDKVEHGFKEDFALLNLISRLQIHEWLKDPENSPLDMKKVHPVLKNRSREDVARMERLKEIFLPYIADKCLEWFPYEGEKYRRAYVENHVLPAAGTYDPAKTDAVREELFSYMPRGGNNAFLHAQYSAPAATQGDTALSADFSAVTRRIKRRGDAGPHFEAEAALFDDKVPLFGGLPVREQAADTLMSGALEAVRAPEDSPVVWGYTCHPKSGVRALAWMEERDITYLREAQGTPGPMETKSYEREVIRKNIAADRAIQEKLPHLPAAKMRGVSTVLSTLDFLDYADFAGKNPEFIAAEGPARLSSDAVLALNMEWLDRNAQGLVMHKGWECHHGEVAMVMRAVGHTLGLIPRAAMEGGKHRMELFLHDPGAPEERQLLKRNLHDVCLTLGAYVEKCLDQSPPVPYREGYVAMARLLHYADMLGDPAGKNRTVQRDPMTGKDHVADIIDWPRVDPAFQGFWHNDPAKKADLSATAPDAAAPSFRDRLRGKILERGIAFFTPEDLKGLDDEFAKTWQERRGDISLQGRANMGRHQTRHLGYGSTS